MPERDLFLPDKPAQPSAVPVTVIIPTRNRSADLRETVATLFRQTSLPHELVIVDQSDSEESCRAVARVIDEMPEHIRSSVTLKYFRDPAISGGAAARNRALDHSTGDIVLFLDDDVALEPEFVDELLKAYEHHPEAGGVSGIITNYPRPALGFRLWSAIFVRGPFHDARQPVYWAAERLRWAAPVAVDRFGAGLMSFRSGVISDVRFDERLTGVCDGEDVDFCQRLPPGTGLLIAPRARLAHNHSPAGRLADHWLRRAARAQVYLYFRNWSRGIWNRLCFLWLLLGYVAVASLASLRKRHLHPWQALLTGYREGLRAAHPPRT